MTLSRAGHLSTTLVFDLLPEISKLDNDDDERGEFLVWTEIADAFRQVVDVWWEEPDDVVESLKRFARSLFEPLVKRLGFEHDEDEDDANTRRFRTLVIAASAAAELPSYEEPCSSPRARVCAEAPVVFFFSKDPRMDPNEF